MWWHTVTHGRGSERGNWRVMWVASTLHTTSEHGVSSITTADAHSSAAGSRLNWRPRQVKWTRPFRRKTKLFSARVPSHFKRSLRTSGRDVKIAQHRRTARFRNWLQNLLNVELLCYATILSATCTVVLSSNACCIGILELPETLSAVKYRSFYMRSLLDLRAAVSYSHRSICMVSYCGLMGP